MTTYTYNRKPGHGGRKRAGTYWLCARTDTNRTYQTTTTPYHATRTHTGGSEAMVVAVAVLRASVAGLERY